MQLATLTKADIQYFADSQRIYKRGITYYKSGRILAYLLKEDGTITAKVKGTRPYTVRIKETPKGTSTYCSCPYDGRCKHLVAVLYYYLEEKQRRGTTSSQHQELMPSLLDISTMLIERMNTGMLRYARDFLNKTQVQAIDFSDHYLQAEIDNKECELRVLPGELRCSCTCVPARWESQCIHAVALLILLQDMKEQGIDNIEQIFRQQRYRSFLGAIDKIVAKEDAPEKDYRIFFMIQDISQLSLTLSKAKRLKNKAYGKHSSLTRKFLEENNLALSSRMKKVLNLILHPIPQDFYYHYRVSRTTPLSVGSAQFHHHLLMALRRLYADEPHSFVNLMFPAESGEAAIHIKKQDEGQYKLHLVIMLGEQAFRLQEVSPVSESGTWYHTKLGDMHVIFEVKEEQEHLTRLNNFSGITFTRQELDTFIDKYYLKLSKHWRVELPIDYHFQEVEIAPLPRLYLSDFSGAFSVKLLFLYKTEEVPPSRKYDIILREEDKYLKIKRDWSKELDWQQQLHSSKLEKKQGTLVPSINPYAWLCDEAPKLISQGFEIFGQDALVNQKIRIGEPDLRIELASGIDWFDLRLEATIEDEKISIPKLLESLEKQDRFIKLSDGSRGVIPKRWLSKLSGVIGFLEQGEQEGSMRANKAHLQVIEELLGIASESQVDEKYKEIRRKFQEFTGIKRAKLPQGINGEPRAYQIEGYNWLHFLKEFSFGGCLADDMGLGKTLQALMLLLYEKEQGNKLKSLIVAPRSLLFNWAMEIKKFTPGLSHFIHHGQMRRQSPESIAKRTEDLVITTYGTMRNDINLFKELKFHYVILDESQRIKNPFAKTTKAAFSLQSNHRLVLSGTPIENNSLELWSQFAFLNPGLLGSMEYFKNTFAKKIEQEKDKQKADSLKNMINPFILIRKKETVARDLPPKQITTLTCEMTPEQQNFYDVWKERYRNEITDALKEKGFQASRMKILAGLTRLRQIANHPLLVDESYTGSSGKFKILVEHINEVIEGGHKVLIFSSFVKMLKLLQNYFDDLGLCYAYLDGQTRKREKAVRTFQEDDSIMIFLISLKAGGLGLNLTAADYVYIVDPWWNPAAEMQAIDRAHRIGQDKHVFVYKTITLGSVEEKILELQQSKLDLVKKVITIEEGIFKKLGQQDVQNLFR